MFDIPTQEQWKAVFDLSKTVLERKPWKIYPEEAIFQLESPQREDPIFVTVHGFEEEVIGVSVHETKSDICKYLNILHKGDNAGFQTIIANQSCVSLQFAEQHFLSPGDITAMQQAQYTPEGNNCILFRKYAPGLAPWYADQSDINLLIEGLELFLKATETEIIPHPEGICLVDCSAEGTVIREIGDDFKNSLPNIVKDDFYVARLKQLKKTSKVIEIESCYLPNPVSGQLSDIPLFPKFCVIADVDGGFIADQCIFDESTEEEEAFFLFIANYFKKEGLPRKIRINKENTGHFLRDLCKRLRIELDERDNLPIVDDFMTMINGITPGE